MTLVAASLLLTGAIHLDGLADCADAFYGSRDRAETLRILKDPRIGTMGGAAIGLSLLGRYAALVSLPGSAVLLALPIVCAFSRTTVLAALRVLPYARDKGGIISAGPSVSVRLTVAAASVVLAVGVLLPIPTAVALLALAAFWRLSWKRIGGCTGDVWEHPSRLRRSLSWPPLHHGLRRCRAGAFFPLARLILPALRLCPERGTEGKKKRALPAGSPRRMPGSRAPMAVAVMITPAMNGPDE